MSTSSRYTKIWRIVTENLMIHVYIDTERMIDNNHSSHNVFIVSLIFPIDVSTLLKNYDMVFFYIAFHITCTSIAVYQDAI